MVSAVSEPESPMRGKADRQGKMFFAIDLESRVRADHPLRAIKATVDRILAGMSEAFAAAYSGTGRPSVPPERLLKALLLMALYSVRSERQLAERIDTDLLFRWFLDMDPAEPAFDPTTFTRNRPRLDAHGLTAAFFDAVLKEALQAGLCSGDHFSVDGTLIESYASLKSFRPAESGSPGGSGPGGDDGGGSAGGRADANAFKPRNAEVDFHGRKRSNATHRSGTDPEAKLFRKGLGKEAKLCHMGHALAENRHGLVMSVAVTEATGTAERDAAVAMLDRLKERHGVAPKTLGTDKGFDAGAFYLELEARGVEPHGAMAKPPRDPARVRRDQKAGVEARVRMRERLATAGYRLSQRCRKKVEECFGWIKGVGGLARSRHVGRWKIRQQMELAAAAYNLIRMRKLLAA
jgi:transposase